MASILWWYTHSLCLSQPSRVSTLCVSWPHYSYSFSQPQPLIVSELRSISRLWNLVQRPSPLTRPDSRITQLRRLAQHRPKPSALLLVSPPLATAVGVRKSDQPPHRLWLVPSVPLPLRSLAPVVQDDRARRAPGSLNHTPCWAARWTTKRVQKKRVHQGTSRARRVAARDLSSRRIGLDRASGRLAGSFLHVSCCCCFDATLISFSPFGASVTLFRSTDACPPVRLSALYSMPAVPWEFLVVAVGFVPYFGLDWALSHHLEPFIHSLQCPSCTRCNACSLVANTKPERGLIAFTGSRRLCRRDSFVDAVASGCPGANGRVKQPSSPPPAHQPPNQRRKSVAHLWGGRYY